MVRHRLAGESIRALAKEAACGKSVVDKSIVSIHRLLPDPMLVEARFRKQVRLLQSRRGR